MSINFTDISTTAKAVIDNCKGIFSALRKGNLKATALQTYALFKLLYNKGLRGKYVMVKNRKIPLTAVVIAIIFLLYAIYPSADIVENNTIKETKQAANVYEKGGIKVYDLRKCNDAVCGLLENSSEDEFAHITINISFFDQTGATVYHGGVEATDVEPMTRMKLNIPSETPFAYFKLGEVEVEK